MLAKLEGHIVSRPPAKPKQSQFAKYRNTPLDIDFQCTISLCQFSHMKPPRKRSRTTNDRLGIFLLIHTHTCTQSTCHLNFETKPGRNCDTRGTHVPDNEFCWECAFLFNQAQHMLQCQTLSNVWITASSKLGLVSPASAWNVPPLASEGKLPWYRDHLQQDVQTRGALMHLAGASSFYSSQVSQSHHHLPLNSFWKSAPLPLQFSKPKYTVVKIFLSEHLREYFFIEY